MTTAIIGSGGIGSVATYHLASATLLQRCRCALQLTTRAALSRFEQDHGGSLLYNALAS